MSLKHDCMFCKHWLTHVYVSPDEQYKEFDVTVRIGGETSTIRARRCGVLCVYTSGHFGCGAWEESEEGWVQNLKKRKERMDREDWNWASGHVQVEGLKGETLLDQCKREVADGDVIGFAPEEVLRAYRFPLTKVIESNVVRELNAFVDGFLDEDEFCEGQQRML